MKKNILLLGFIVILLYVKLDAQKFRFDHYSKKDGLSNKSVYCTLQDKNGYLWFGTREGLNRFDGYGFKVYQHIPFTKNSLSDSYITSLEEDDSLNLWIGTANGGLNKLNLNTGEFTHFFHSDSSENSISHNGVWALCKDSRTNLWIGTENGLDMLNLKTKKITKVLENTYIISLYEDNEGFIWIGTGSGVYKLNSLDDSTVLYSKALGVKNSIADNRVWTTYQDKMDNYWFGTQNGLSFFETKTNLYKNYFINNNGTSRSSFIVPIYEDTKNNLWVGTIGGGLRLYQDQKFIDVIFDENNRNTVWDIFEDRSGCIWFCTLDGILKLNYEKQNFRLINKSNNELSDNFVLSMMLDSKNELWVGTSNGGITVFNQFGVADHYINSKNILTHNEVNSIFQDNKNNYWIGTGNGLNIINSDKYLIKRYFNDPENFHSISNSRISKITQDTYGNIWVGTFEGLNKFNNEDKSFKRFLFDPNDNGTLRSDVITTLYNDKDGDLWVGMQSGGLAKINPKTDQIKNFVHSKNDTTSISHNYVRVIFEDSKNRFWVGTFSGLNLFDKQKKEFKHYSMIDGLSNNIISGLCEDKKGNLWISTNHGINKFNYSTGKFESYFEIDGLQDDEFNSGAFLSYEGEELLFGGNKGITKFYPDSLSNDKFLPQVIIKSLKKIDETIELNTHGISDKEILIAFDKNYFEVEFLSFDYKNPVKNIFSYKLEGFDNNHIISNSNSATYMNLPEGEYMFTVKGSSSSGNWNENISSIKILVIPPFYKSWWFIVISILAIFIVVFSLVFLKFRNIVVLEKLRTNIAADLHDTIGTNLTEIIMTSEILSYSAVNEKNELNNGLNQITNSARSVMDSMSDIVWLIKSKGEGTLIEIFNRLRENFDNLFRIKEVDFVITNYEKADNIKISIEKKRQLYLIFKEFINNSIKHSNCSKILLNFNNSINSNIIKISDDGIGFDLNNVDEGNGLGNIRKRIENINGEFKYKSEMGKGTELEIKFS